MLVFDAHEFMYVDETEKGTVPPELRSMFDSVWVDLDADDDSGNDSEDDDWASGFVGYDMAATCTGVVVTEEDLRRAVEQGYHRVRTLTYRK